MTGPQGTDAAGLGSARTGRSAAWVGAPLALVLLLVLVWAQVYLPRLSLLPQVHSDDFFLLSPAVQWVRTGELTRRVLDSPFPNSAALYQEHPTPGLINSGYFLLLGMASRLGGPSLATARLVAAVGMLVVATVVALVVAGVTRWRVGLVAGLVTLLDHNLWYAGRVVRSDAPTAAAGLLGLYLAWTGARQRRLWLLAPGALLVGVAQSMHPVAMVYGLAFALLVWGPLLWHRRWRALLVATVFCAVPMGAYLGTLAANRDLVRASLRFGNTAQAGSEQTAETWSVWDHVRAEPRRYQIMYDSPYPRRMGRVHQAGYALGAVTWAALSAVLLWRGWRSGRRWPRDVGGCAAALWGISTFVLTVVANPAQKSPTYLVHVAPLLYAGGACLLLHWGPERLARAGASRVAATLPIAAAVVALICFGWGGAAYGAWYRTFDAGWRYGQVTRSLANHLPADALLVGPPPMEAVTWQTGAHFLHNRWVGFLEPAFPRFPWRPQRGAHQHLYRYPSDPAALAEVAALAPGGLYLAMSDQLLMWNGYAPHGARYGAAVQDWQQTVRTAFVPVAEHYSTVHGRTAMYRYVGDRPAAVPPPVRYWNGQRIRLGPPLPGGESVGALARALGTDLKPDGSLAVEADPFASPLRALHLPPSWSAMPLLASLEVSVRGPPDARFAWAFPAAGRSLGTPWMGHPQRLRHHYLIPASSGGWPTGLIFVSPSGPAVGRIWEITVRPVELAPRAAPE